jgi:hypothetical protein
MARAASKGACRLCGQPYAKAGMGRHLAKCLQARGVAGATPDAGKSARLLAIDTPYSSPYWLYVLASSDVTLHRLDRFLRDIWCECCGHLSEFSLGGANMGLSRKLATVPFEHSDLCYEYDFGDTTTLRIRVSADVTGLRLAKPLHLLARNDEPVYPCALCGGQATCLDAEDPWSEDTYHCDACADKEGLDEMRLELVNSPRTGMCGYSGPSVEPD